MGIHIKSLGLIFCISSFNFSNPSLLYLIIAGFFNLCVLLFSFLTVISAPFYCPANTDSITSINFIVNRYCRWCYRRLYLEKNYFKNIFVDFALISEQVIWWLCQVHSVSIQIILAYQKKNCKFSVDFCYCYSTVKWMLLY